MAVLDGNFVLPGLLRILGNLSHTLDVLTAEVKCLNVERCSLSSEIQQLRKNVTKKVRTPSLSPTPYSSIVAQPSVSSTTVPLTASVASSRNVPPDVVGRPTPGSVNRESLSTNAALANTENTEDDGFTLVGPRR